MCDGFAALDALLRRDYPPLDVELLDVKRIKIVFRFFSIFNELPLGRVLTMRLASVALGIGECGEHPFSRHWHVHGPYAVHGDWRSHWRARAQGRWRLQHHLRATLMMIILNCAARCWAKMAEVAALLC